MARKSAVVDATLEDTTVLDEAPTLSALDDLDRMIWATKTLHIDTSTQEGLATHKVREALVQLAEQIRKILAGRLA